ncbi:hypothetical protein H6F75_00560 [Nodosilinea sp. FACHB-131]|uniref:hypothetical protein n=1 Tax=Cyanophyceae TaxID=3028117 RepID=UPI0016844F2D|nr:hypothetical protein [Nodosilinea sp. FACHB-131]MBD1871962.1 hypothetical protein [Nodosilinea sp. FACHB-131]
MPTALATEPRRNEDAFLYLKTEAEQVDDGVLVPALLFTEGDFVDATGKPGKYTKTDLDRIVRATRKYYSAGDDIPIFESNHDLGGGGYRNADKIGKLAVDEGLSVDQITTENLPDPRLTDLVGRYGIFGNGLITRTDAVQRYSQKLIKPLSIAFDPSGGRTNGNKWSVFEVSAVPWGAVRGAMFFSKYFPEESVARFALTLDGAMAESKGRYDDPMDERTGQALMVFNDVLRNIRNTTDDELQGRSRDGLTRQAIADLSAKLTEMLGVAAPELPPVTLSKFIQEGTTAMTTDNKATEDNKPKNEATTTEPPKAETVDIAGLMKRIDELEAKAKQQENRAEEAEQVVAHLKAEGESLKFERKVSDRVTRLYAKAQKLLSVGKIKPAAFAEWFPETESTADAVVRFSQAIQSEETQGDPLDEIEAALKYADKYAEPVRFGSFMGQQAIGDNPLRDKDEISEADQAKVNAVVKSAAAKRYY